MYWYVYMFLYCTFWRCNFPLCLQLMKMVVANGLPFRVVNNNLFRTFVKEVQKFKGDYTPPSDFPLRTTLLEKTYNLVADDLQVYLTYVYLKPSVDNFVSGPIGELPLTSAKDLLQPGAGWLDRHPGAAHSKHAMPES